VCTCGVKQDGAHKAHAFARAARVKYVVIDRFFKYNPETKATVNEFFQFVALHTFSFNIFIERI